MSYLRTRTRFITFEQSVVPKHHDSCSRGQHILGALSLTFKSMLRCIGSEEAGKAAMGSLQGPLWCESSLGVHMCGLRPHVFEGAHNFGTDLYLFKHQLIK